MSLAIGSLFAGIGGLELGLEWAGFGPVKWQVEREEFCRDVLARHWPDAARFDDVCSVGAADLEPVEVICGGFPCQDISNAGKRAGLAGARSGLWHEYARIVRQLRPRAVVVENVAALANRGLGTVLGDLAALGYDTWWDCVRASDCGAPQRRERLFVVAWRRVADADGERKLQSRMFIHEERRWSTDGRDRDAANLVNADGQHREECGGVPVKSPTQDAGPSVRGVRQHRGSAESGVGRRTDGLPSGMDRWPARPGDAQHAWEQPRTKTGVSQRQARLKALGNAVVPQVAYAIGCVVRELLGVAP